MSSRRRNAVVLLAALGAALAVALAAASTGAPKVSSAGSPTGSPTGALRSPAPPPAMSGPDVASRSPAAAVAPSEAGEVRAALAVLHAWDARRAAAYARGSLALLRDLYVRGSRAGVADTAVLRGYRSRALRVSGLRTQVLAISILHRGPGRWTARVTDRVQGGAVEVAGHRRPLPRDAASTRVLTLVRAADHRWRMARVEDARLLSRGRPAAASPASGGRSGSPPPAAEPAPPAWS